MLTLLYINLSASPASRILSYQILSSLSFFCISAFKFKPLGSIQVLSLLSLPSFWVENQLETVGNGCHLSQVAIPLLSEGVFEPLAGLDGTPEDRQVKLPGEWF